MRFKNRKGAYGSHIPVLRSINKLRKIATIFEDGMGIYSTATFLDANYYPSLKSLISVESDQEWYDYITGRYKDSRFSANFLKSPQDIETHIPDHVDLCFVDGKIPERNFMMESCRDRASIYVMHDAEDYSKKVLHKFANVYIYKTPARAGNRRKRLGLPPTAICSDTEDVNLLSDIIKWENDYVSWEL